MRVPKLPKIRTLLAAGGGLALVVGATTLLGGHAASAQGSPTPWAPGGVSGDTSAISGLAFFDSSGHQITSGSTTTAPFAAYVVGQQKVRTAPKPDTKASLFLYLPVTGQTPDNWTTFENIGSPTVYPPTAAGTPAVIAAATVPVNTGLATDNTLDAILGDEGPTSSNAGYQNVYEVRMKTSGPSGQSTQYDYADISIDSTTHTWTLVYTPDGPFPPAGGSPVSTATTLSALPAGTAAAGSSIALTATVSPADSTGTVQFFDGSTAIDATPVAVSGGTASTTTTTLPIGTDSLTAIFTPTDSTAFETSTSTALSYSVTSAAVSTSSVLTVNPAGSQTLGSTATLTDTVTPSGAAGTVQFFDGSTAVNATPVAVSGGTAGTTTSTLGLGSHSLKAVFTPTDTGAFSPSTTAVVTYQVNPVPATTTTTSLTVNPTGPTAFGTTVTLTGNVTPSSAAGKIQFLDGATPIGLPVTVSAGSATATTATLASGSHALTAAFTPTDASAFGSSTSATQTLVVDAQATTSVLAASPSSPQNQGTSVSLTDTLTPSSAAGTVQFFDGATAIGAAVPVTAGVAQVSTATLDVSTHDLTAVFTPTSTASYTGSSSNSVSYQITPPPPGATTTTLAVTPTGPVLQGATVTLAAIVGPTGAVGTVQFLDGVTPIGAPVTVVAGAAQTTTTALTVGTHTLSASFVSGSASFLDSTSGNTTLQVAAATTTTLTANPTSAIDNYDVVLSAAVSGSGVAGSVQFFEGATSLGSAPVTNGTATVTTAFATAGSHSLTATFTPTDPAAFAASTGSATLAVTDPSTSSNVSATDSSGNPLSGPITLADGDTITVTITGATPDSTLTVTLHSSPVVLGTTQADGTGSASFTFTVPAGTTAGAHSLAFTDGSGTVVGTAAFTVAAASDPTGTSTGTPGSPAAGDGSDVDTGDGSTLANTGSNAALLTTVGLSVFAAGGLLLLMSRRRRPSGRH